MRRRSFDRRVYLLVFGFNDDEWARSAEGEKCRRWCKDLGFNVDFKVTPSVVETIKYIREHKMLDLVYFSDNKSSSRGDHALSDAMAIAQVLSEHSHKPWVAIAPVFDYLSTVFRVRDVVVGEGDLLSVVWSRWMSLVKGYRQTP